MFEKKNSFLTKFLVFLFIIFAVLVSLAITKQVSKKKEIQNEIKKLQQEAEKINQENFLAQERISYFESSDYQEREAKEKLNLKNPDENVVVVKPGIVKKETNEIQENSNTVPAKKEPRGNPLKWWLYFTSN